MGGPGVLLTWCQVQSQSPAVYLGKAFLSKMPNRLWARHTADCAGLWTTVLHTSSTPPSVLEFELLRVSHYMTHLVRGGLALEDILQGDIPDYFWSLNYAELRTDARTEASKDGCRQQG